jgi:hypothetical protein
MSEGLTANSGQFPACSCCETVIQSTEPATLGALAMGAPGLSIWRREESVLVGD